MAMSRREMGRRVLAGLLAGPSAYTAGCYVAEAALPVLSAEPMVDAILGGTTTTRNPADALASDYPDWRAEFRWNGEEWIRVV